MIRQLVVVILILMLTGIPGVVANETTPVSFEEGTTAKETTEVIMDKGTVTFTDKATGLSATTTTTINGVAFVPTKTTESKDLEWSTGELDPIVKMVYSYDGKTLKETITLKEDKVLTFPITLSTYSKLIPWDHGQWKIVASNSFETMNGIVLEKPYGIDALGKRIEMEYKYDKDVLTLVYDRTITEWGSEEKIVIDNKTGMETTETVWVPAYSAIIYPLVIDPTWVSFQGHWIDNTTNATYTLEMWNATGTTTWTPRPGVTSVEYLTIAGAGAGGFGYYGGGGGAGGFLTCSTLAVSGSQTIVVGAGGSVPANDAVRGGDGGFSLFGSINATGGGGGGSRNGTFSGGAANGAPGGSGGGAGYVSSSGGLGVSGQGKDGGSNDATQYGAGGGGANTTGDPGVGASGITCGGTGLPSSITDVLIHYAGGGGGGGGWTQCGSKYSLGGGGLGGRSSFRGGLVAGTAGTNGLGAGGGGGGENVAGYTGGSGVVIIKYATPIIASFTSDVTSGSSPLVVNFTNTSSSQATSFEWNYTTLTNSTPTTFNTTANPVQSFTGGNYSIKLRAYNALTSNVSTQITWINVSDAFDFVGTPTTGSTYAMKVAFTNTTVGVINSTYYFGDGYSSTATNPTHFYSVAGLYTVNASFGNATTITWVNKTNYINLTSDDDANLKSWLHMNGTPGGTIFNGEKGSAWVPTSVTTSTAQYKFNGSSAWFNSVTSRLQTSSSPIFNLSTSNFTLEQWVYPTSSANNMFLLSRTTSGTLKNDGWGIYHSTTSAASDAWVFFAGTAAAGSTGLFTLPLNTWSHLAVERDAAGNVVVYVNGVSVATKAGLNGNYDTVNPITYGDTTGVSTAFQGYIDETRISTTTRWGSAYSPPYAEYRGNLFITYPDPNPDSTLRFKTNPDGVALISNLTPRYRTLQIQYVSINASNISVLTGFNPEHLVASSVVVNASVFSNQIITYSSIDNVNGLVTANVTRAAGYSTLGLVEERGSFIDVVMHYYNYTPPDEEMDASQFYGNGFLTNGTTNIVYPVHSFITTPVTFAPWITMSNFTVSNTTPILFETDVKFASELNYTANRFLWNYGDGVTETTTNGIGNHTYTSVGAKNVSLTAYLWQNNSVTNTTTLYHAVNASYNNSYVKADFTGVPTSGTTGLAVVFTDLSVFGNATSGRTYNWSFGDMFTSASAFSNAVNPVHVYSALGIYDVVLTVNNSYGSDNETKTGYITIATSQSNTALNLLYPKDVTFRITDRFGASQPYVNVSVIMYNSTISNTNWFSTLIGVSPVADPLQSTFLTGFTDTEGEISFPMIASGRYTITAVNVSKGISMNRVLYPTQAAYVFVVATSDSAAGLIQSDYVNASLFVTSYVPASAHLNFTYADISNSTATLTFYVNAANGTRLYTDVAISNYTYSNSYEVANTKMAGYVWGYFADNTLFGNITQALGITMKGTDDMLIKIIPCRNVYGSPYATGWGNTC